MSNRIAVEASGALRRQTVPQAALSLADGCGCTQHHGRRRLQPVSGRVLTAGMHVDWTRSSGACVGPGCRAARRPGVPGQGDEVTSSSSCPVTVVIATMDRRDNVLTTLRHLAALPEQPPVVLVDNGSRDGTAEAVEQAFPEVTVLRPGRNLGAVGRTVGVEAARTPLVAFADDDSWWAPGALHRAADHFAAAPRLGLLAGQILIGPQEELDPVCAQMARSPLPPQADVPGRPVLGFLACGAVVRRSAYLEVGGFSPVVFFLGEETLLAQDLAAAGWGVAYVDDVVAHHHPGAAGNRTGRARLQARNALLSAWLRRPLPVALAHAARAAARSGSAVHRGALLDALRRLPSVVRSRRVLPADIEAQVRLLETSG